MSRVAPIVPAENDILCESCGYTLNGLSENGNCPECGEPIAQSTAGDRREPPAFERISPPRLASFLQTTLAVMFRPAHFYRTTTTRADTSADRTFARVHWLTAAALFAATFALHSKWYFFDILGVSRPRTWLPMIGLAVSSTIAIYVALDAITRLAAKLTAWEAAYRGYRLPYRAVLRAMHYHAAHYLPVAIVAFVTVAGFTALLSRHVLGVDASTKYLYVLCAEVIVGAVYLFQTYWIAMRNMMYANR